MSKQKTILEWLEFLPDGYREICKMEYDINYAEDQYQKSLKDAIAASCHWQGVKFCYDNFMSLLYSSINKDNSINYEKLPSLPENWKALFKEKAQKNHNKKRNKLAVKIFLAWSANAKVVTHMGDFDNALVLADEIIKKLNQ